MWMNNGSSPLLFALMNLTAWSARTSAVCVFFGYGIVELQKRAGLDGGGGVALRKWAIAEVLPPTLIHRILAALGLRQDATFPDGWFCNLPAAERPRWSRL